MCGFVFRIEWIVYLLRLFVNVLFNRSLLVLFQMTEYRWELRENCLAFATAAAIAVAIAIAAAAAAAVDFNIDVVVVVDIKCYSWSQMQAMVLHTIIFEIPCLNLVCCYICLSVCFSVCVCVCFVFFSSFDC